MYRSTGELYTQKSVSGCKQICWNLNGQQDWILLWWIWDKNLEKAGPDTAAKVGEDQIWNVKVRDLG